MYILLSSCQHDLRKLTTVMKEYTSKVVVNIAVPLYQLVLILTGSDKTENSFELIGRAMNEETFPTELKETGKLHEEKCLAVTKLLTCSFLGNSHTETLALHQRFQSKRFAKEIEVSLGSRQRHLYGALMAMALFKQSRKRWY